MIIYRSKLRHEGIFPTHVFDNITKSPLIVRWPNKCTHDIQELIMEIISYLQGFETKGDTKLGSDLARLHIKEGNDWFVNTEEKELLHNFAVLPLEDQMAVILRLGKVYERLSGVPECLKKRSL